MEEKQFRQRNFEKKSKFTRAIRQQALSKIDLQHHYGPQNDSLEKITIDYLEASEKIMQLEKEDREQLRKDKIYPFHEEVMSQYSRWVFWLKNEGNLHMKSFERRCYQFYKYKKDTNKRIFYDLVIQNKNQFNKKNK